MKLLIIIRFLKRLPCWFMNRCRKILRFAREQFLCILYFVTLYEYLLLIRVILLSTVRLASSRLQDLAITQLFLSAINVSSLHFLQITALIFYLILAKPSKTFNFSRYSGGISEILVYNTPVG